MINRIRLCNNKIIVDVNYLNADVVNIEFQKDLTREEMHDLYLFIKVKKYRIEALKHIKDTEDVSDLYSYDIVQGDREINATTTDIENYERENQQEINNQMLKLNELKEEYNLLKQKQEQNVGFVNQSYNTNQANAVVVDNSNFKTLLWYSIALCGMLTLVLYFDIIGGIILKVAGLGVGIVVGGYMFIMLSKVFVGLIKGIGYMLIGIGMFMTAFWIIYYLFNAYNNRL